MSDAAVEIANVSKKFRIYHERNQTLKSAAMRRRRSIHEDFWALKDVSFDIPKGSNFAIVGSNGSGKSTLLKCIAGILYPNAGEIRTRGRLAALLEIGSGFHPELSGRDNVFLNASILGISKSEIRQRFDEIVDFSGVEKFIDQPVKNYSSGMYVRLAFAVAINVDPEVLLVDEVLAVGDASFQQKCMEKFAQLQGDGRTIIVVSHAVSVLRTMCDKGAWLNNGELLDVGDIKPLLNAFDDASRPTPHVDGIGRTRWGSGQIVIDHVEVLTADGLPFARFITSHSAVRLRLRYTANERIEKALFSISIDSSDGTRVWGGNNFESMAPVEIGDGVMDFTVPAMPLAKGDYTIDVAIFDWSTQRQLDLIKHVVQLQIENHGASESGYIALNGKWRVSESQPINGHG